MDQVVQKQITDLLSPSIATAYTIIDKQIQDSLNEFQIQKWYFGAFTAVYSSYTFIYRPTKAKLISSVSILLSAIRHVYAISDQNQRRIIS